MQQQLVNLSNSMPDWNNHHSFAVQTIIINAFLSLLIRWKYIMQQEPVNVFIKPKHCLLRLILIWSAWAAVDRRRRLSLSSSFFLIYRLLINCVRHNDYPSNPVIIFWLIKHLHANQPTRCRILFASAAASLPLDCKSRAHEQLYVYRRDISKQQDALNRCIRGADDVLWYDWRRLH